MNPRPRRGAAALSHAPRECPLWLPGDTRAWGRAAPVRTTVSSTLLAARWPRPGLRLPRAARSRGGPGTGVANENVSCISFRYVKDVSTNLQSPLLVRTYAPLATQHCTKSLRDSGRPARHLPVHLPRRLRLWPCVRCNHPRRAHQPWPNPTRKVCVPFDMRRVVCMSPSNSDQPATLSIPRTAVASVSPATTGSAARCYAHACGAWTASSCSRSVLRLIAYQLHTLLMHTCRAAV